MSTTKYFGYRLPRGNVSWRCEVQDSGILFHLRESQVVANAETWLKLTQEEMVRLDENYALFFGHNELLPDSEYLGNEALVCAIIHRDINEISTIKAWPLWQAPSENLIYGWLQVPDRLFESINTWEPQYNQLFVAPLTMKEREVFRSLSER